MLKRRLLMSAGAVGVAAVFGFFAGQLRHPAVASPAQAAAVVADNASALPGDIAVAPAALANMQLQFAKAADRPLVQDVRVTGTVGFDQLRLAQITPPARGRVERIEAVVGEHVQAGQLLAVLDDFDLSGARSEVAGAQAAVVQARAQAETAQAALERAEELVGTGGMAQSQLDVRRADLASAQAMLQTRQAELRQWQDTEQRLMPIAAGGNAGNAAAADADPRDSEGAIVAPFGGVVDTVGVSAGEIVDTTQPVFTVADLSTVWVQVDVPENELGEVQVGDDVTLAVDAYPGRKFQGRVSYIADKVDPNTGTVAVRCEVPNPDEALRVNMFVNADILQPLGREAVLVPDAALQDVNGQTAVFTPDGGGHFSWHAVRTGVSSGGFTEILSGIASGTPVVTDGSYWLKASLLAQTIPDEG